jgi:carbon monoxide dehydrogenase subunit G
MRIEGRWQPQYPIEEVWAVLYDPDVLARHAPGVQSMEEVGPDRFSLDLKLAVAGIGGRYAATLQRSEVQPPSHCLLHIDGKGPVGAVKVDGAIDLSPADGGTTVSYGGDAAVAGPMAAVANRLMGGVAKMLLGQFFTDLEQELAGRHAPAPVAEPGRRTS